MELYCSDKPTETLLFSSKVNTLLYLQSRVTCSKIETIYVFTVSDFKSNPETICKNISFNFLNKVIIRSSAGMEDLSESTNAGHFCSKMYINPTSESEVSSAIIEVIHSYQKDNLGEQEQIFVQEQIANSIVSGVALTREPNNRPYYLINYDDAGSTNSVTIDNCKKTLYISRNTEALNDIKWSNLYYAIKEIEHICNNTALDIEFAISNSNEVIIFQVRKLNCAIKGISDEDSFKIKESCGMAYNKCSDSLSDMAFWNPSEIIGSNPHNLDYSLYSYLITDSAWNEGIVKMGYSEISGFLMEKYGNKPYILR